MRQTAHNLQTPRSQGRKSGSSTTRESRGRQSIPGSLAFWLVGAISLLMLFAGGAASPLYRVYQAKWDFSASTLTAIFAVYVLALLITLVVFGGLSDYVGRRPVLLAGVGFQATACLLFVTATGVGSLFAARATQGIAVGLTASAIGATLVELRPDGIAPLVSTAAPNLGLATGALVTSALVQYAPAPTHLVWILILGGLVAGFVIVLAIPETRPRQAGAVASLWPHLEVPPAVRGTFVAVLPAIVAVWGLGGLYLALGPSLAADLAHSTNLLWGGLIIFILTSFGAAASSASRSRDPKRVMLAGCVTLIVGVLTTAAAVVATSSLLLILGTIIAGLGFGPAFTGAYRAIVALADPQDMAGLIAAIFTVTYAAFGAPVVVAGVATQEFGLHETALVYSIGVSVLAGVAALSLGIEAHEQSKAPTRVAVPPGPCTVPPCPPLEGEPSSGATAAGATER
jgi:MFS family permease